MNLIFNNNISNSTDNCLNPILDENNQINQEIVDIKQLYSEFIINNNTDSSIQLHLISAFDQ